jgi:hypothetical protein
VRVELVPGLAGEHPAPGTRIAMISLSVTSSRHARSIPRRGVLDTCLVTGARTRRRRRRRGCVCPSTQGAGAYPVGAANAA